MTDRPRVTLEVDGAVAFLTMARPEALNAFDAPMIEQMRACVALISNDARPVPWSWLARVDPFCTGVDVKGLQAGSVRLEWFRAWHEMTRELEAVPVPVVAAIRGHCLGGGLMLTLAVDYRIASDDLQIGLGAVRHAILPGSAPQRLASVVGAAAARRLCLFGEYVSAPEALRIGLVDRVVAGDELVPAARSLAERAASFSPGTVRELKALLRVAPSLDDDGYATTYLEAQQRCLDEHDREQEPAAPSDDRQT